MQFLSGDGYSGEWHGFDDVDCIDFARCQCGFAQVSAVAGIDAGAGIVRVGMHTKTFADAAVDGDRSDRAGSDVRLRKRGEGYASDGFHVHGYGYIGRNSTYDNNDANGAIRHFAELKTPEMGVLRVCEWSTIIRRVIRKSTKYY